MLELREAKLNGIKCEGIAKEFNTNNKKYWEAFVKIPNAEFQSEDKYIYEGVVKVGNELKFFEDIMFTKWPIKGDEYTFLKLIRSKASKLANPIIKNFRD
ncbi:MAG: hypothetical protein U5K69_22925 [Balneolaceae bacterium]|nr:hypothetical protein [Balneolaceae bacterium]